MKRAQIENAYKEYDGQRKWLRDQIQTHSYLNRLIKEFNGDVKKAKEEQQRRLENLRPDYVLENRTTSGDLGQGREGYFNIFGRTHLPNTLQEYDKSLEIHEGEHQLTTGEIGMSETAKKLYKNSYDSNSVSTNMTSWGETQRVYYSHPTERDARKKQLEFEMEKLGIKKYGEKFTYDHYQKLLKLAKEGKLQSNAEEFLRMTKPEYIVEIMNTVAENGNSQEDMTQA